MQALTELPAGTNGDGWDHMNGWGGGWMWLWGVAMMALFVGLIVWIARAGTTPSTQSPRPPDPLDRARGVLPERHARGELTTEEYRERVSELQ